MEHITIRNISRGYGHGESAVKALDNVSLDISKGLRTGCNGAIKDDPERVLLQ